MVLFYVILSHPISTWCMFLQKKTLKKDIIFLKIQHDRLLCLLPYPLYMFCDFRVVTSICELIILKIPTAGISEFLSH